MEIAELANLDPSNQIVASNDINEIAQGLRSVLEDCAGWHFNYCCIVSGGKGSIHLLLEQPTEGSVSLSTPMLPDEMARHLLLLTDTEARYPPNPGNGRKKGWIIRSVMIDHWVAAIAEAAWV